jgi:hypothetical protein
VPITGEHPFERWLARLGHDPEPRDAGFGGDEQTPAARFDERFHIEARQAVVDPVHCEVATVEACKTACGTDPEKSPGVFEDREHAIARKPVGHGEPANGQPIGAGSGRLQQHEEDRGGRPPERTPHGLNIDGFRAPLRE